MFTVSVPAHATPGPRVYAAHVASTARQTIRARRRIPVLRALVDNVELVVARRKGSARHHSGEHIEHVGPTDRVHPGSREGASGMSDRWVRVVYGDDRRVGLL